MVFSCMNLQLSSSKTCFHLSSYSLCAGFVLHQLPESALASECIFWTVLFPPELCVYKSSLILRPIPWQHAAFLTAKIKTFRIVQKTICIESCKIFLLIRAPKNVKGSTTEISFLPLFLNRWVASVGNTEITLAHNEKHNCTAAGGIDVINMLPRRFSSQRKQHSPT